MSISPHAPADRRALFGAAALGGCLGLALGGAYLVGGLARVSADRADDAASAPAVALAGVAPAAAPPPTFAHRVSLTARRLVDAAPPFALRGPLAASRDLECLSQAVYYEARGESDGGQAAVAQVVLNRVRHPRFPKSVCGVVFQHAGDGCQFSFACDGATRHAVEGGAWRRAERIASRALSGFVMRDVGAATDFRGGGLSAAGMMRVAQVGGHVFYRFGGPLGQPSALTATPHASTGGERAVAASFTPPSLTQVMAAGAKLVERVTAPATRTTPDAAPAPSQAASTAPVLTPAKADTAKPDAAPAASPAA